MIRHSCSEKLFSLRASRLGPCRLGGLAALRLRGLSIDSLEFILGQLNDVMSLEVFEVEEDWSSACISVRTRCVFDIISLTYARFFYWLESMLEVSSGLLDVF